MSVVTAEDLKVLYEADLREEVGNLLVSKEERLGLWALLSASRRAPGCRDRRPRHIRPFKDRPGGISD